MHRAESEESISYASRADDRFFVIATFLLPIIAQGAYLFDVFHYHASSSLASGYEGLLSSILSVFAYLQYSVPIRSRWIRFFYHLCLWILGEIGTIAHVIYYAKKNDVFHLCLYTAWGVIDSIYFACLIYCRVFSKHHGLRVHMPIEQEHLFHFISRLEVILAIFIPVFFSSRLITLTKDNIAFYILFDFFAESYHRFRGIAIKATLYIFVIAVTASVATEWIYITGTAHVYEVVSLICEVIAAALCDTLIVMQFFPGNFTSTKKHRNRHVQKVLSKPSVSTQRNLESFADSCSLDTNVEGSCVAYF
jgi:hypothetical protein